MLEQLDLVSREKFELDVAALREADEKEGRIRSFAALANAVLGLAGEEACIELSHDLLYIEALHGCMGADQNGRTSLGEMERLWSKEGITDEGERDALMRLWRAMESETSKFLWEQRKELEAEARNRD